MRQEFDWIETDGGPLIFAADSVLSLWRGDDRSGGPTPSDYERACAVTDEVGLIDVGATQALVLGDEPDRTTLLRHPSGLLIVRWRWADSENSLLSALLSADMEQLQYGHTINFSARAEPYVMFDSASSGAGVTNSLRVGLQERTYIVETAQFSPDATLNVLVHRLRN